MFARLKLKLPLGHHQWHEEDKPSRRQDASPSEIEAAKLTLDQRRNQGFKYGGYPELTKSMASCHDFCVLRRFTKLGMRTALWLQDEISILETEIERLDHISMYVDKDGRVDSFRDDKIKLKERDECMRKLVPLVKEYYQFLNTFSAIRSRPTAEDCQIENAQIWMENWEHAIQSPEDKFVYKEGDLIALVTKPKSFYRQLLERLPLIRWLFKNRRKRDDREDCESVAYHSDRWLEFGTSVVIISFGVGMLLGPLWWLESVQGNRDSLKIISGFVIGFAVLVFGSMTTAARGFEVLGATAAYAAVLAVFLQINVSS